LFGNGPIFRLDNQGASVPIHAGHTRFALIVAHGQPSDPAPAETALAGFAAAIASHLPGWAVASATLADPEALPRALDGRRGALVYPVFMADGWFTQVALPQRLAAAGAAGARVLPPFGVDPALPDLCHAILAEATAKEGWHKADTRVLLAAHGSFKSPAPARVAGAVAQSLVARGWAEVRPGFIDQDPQIATQGQGLGPRALCLPFFAARGGHVEDDIPRALHDAGFAGRLLAPVGCDPRVPAMIAGRLRVA
jgi:sirohydrochlorin ferrochelatase